MKKQNKTDAIEEDSGDRDEMKYIIYCCLFVGTSIQLPSYFVLLSSGWLQAMACLWHYTSHTYCNYIHIHKFSHIQRLFLRFHSLNRLFTLPTNSLTLHKKTKERQKKSCLLSVYIVSPVLPLCRCHCYCCSCSCSCSCWWWWFFYWCCCIPSSFFRFVLFSNVFFLYIFIAFILSSPDFIFYSNQLCCIFFLFSFVFEREKN